MEKDLEQYFDRLWPICRSITGNGLRESLKILNEIIPLELTEVPSGTKVFDWQIPNEWNIEDAYIITPDGKKICNFKVNNLHIVNYSIPVNREILFEELSAHLHTRPDLPDAIPYVTSYYKEDWGFCLSHNDFSKLPTSGIYKIYIQSSLKPGGLTYGQCYLKGESEKEILFSTYLCHPSMANNELSGPLVSAFLYKKLKSLPKRKYSYRFVFAPETIGVISFLSKHGRHLLSNLHAGYVLTCVGDDGPFTYKRSRKGNTVADKAAEHALRYSGKSHSIIDFSIGGSDERQYCSPGFNFPVGSLMRTKYQNYFQYHTSLDDKKFISFPAMKETIEMYLSVVRIHELNEHYKTNILYCEPQLGKRGLYPNQGGTVKVEVEAARRIVHLLAFADGNMDLINIAEKRGESALLFEDSIKKCFEAGLIGV